MEELKKPSDIVKPDERQAFFSLVDPVTGRSRPLMLEDLYASAASINLHCGVPESIRSHFAGAKNLLVYAWYYYPFNVTARFISMVSIEYALRVRFGASPSTPLKHLVRKAVEEGLIRDEGFSHLDSVNDEGESVAESPARTSIPNRSRYVDRLIDLLPRLRNSLAHGTHMVHPHSARSVQIAADFINQLFVKPADTPGVDTDSLR